ncbi:unnamed protein product [Brassica oleracea]
MMMFAQRFGEEDHHVEKAELGEEDGYFRLLHQL